MRVIMVAQRDRFPVCNQAVKQSGCRSGRGNRESRDCDGGTERKVELVRGDFKLAAVRTPLTRLFLWGIASLALLALSYPGKFPTVRSETGTMTCCQQQAKDPCSHAPAKPATPDPQGLPCCPGCALAFNTVSDAPTGQRFLLGGGETLSFETQAAVARAQRPLVPPPRSAVA
jgi:hypothetical protein